MYSEVNTTVRAWLNGVNPTTGALQALPLGLAQRAAFDPDPPISERNAYVGSTVQADGYSTGAGLNRDAIVKVELNPNDTTSPWYGTQNIVYGTDPNDADPNRRRGIRPAVVTGMIQWQDRNLIDVSIQHNAGLTEVALHNLDNIAVNDLGITQTAVTGTDWVTFRVTLGTIGRRHENFLTGPSAGAISDDLTERRNVFYELYVNNAVFPTTTSPATDVTLPDFVLPTPVQAAPAGSLTINFRGAAEARGVGQGQAQTNTVRIKDDDWNVPFNDDDLLGTVSVNVPHPAGAWNGLLLPYSGTLQLFINGSGNVAGPGGSSGEGEAEIYQELVEPNFEDPFQSDTITVP